MDFGGAEEEVEEGGLEGGWLIRVVGGGRMMGGG